MVLLLEDFRLLILSAQAWNCSDKPVLTYLFSSTSCSQTPQTSQYLLTYSNTLRQASTYLLTQTPSDKPVLTYSKTLRQASTYLLEHPQTSQYLLTQTPSDKPVLTQTPSDKPVLRQKIFLSSFYKLSQLVICVYGVGLLRKHWICDFVDTCVCALCCFY
jgi:hypothetical protein